MLQPARERRPEHLVFPVSRADAVDSLQPATNDEIETLYELIDQHTNPADNRGPKQDEGIGTPDHPSTYGWWTFRLPRWWQPRTV